MHLLSQIIYSCKTLYMFRTVFSSIIRSSKLRVQQWYMSNSCCYMLLSGMRWNSVLSYCRNIFRCTDLWMLNLNVVACSAKGSGFLKYRELTESASCGPVSFWRRVIRRTARACLPLQELMWWNVDILSSVSSLNPNPILGSRRNSFCRMSRILTLPLIAINEMHLLTFFVPQ
jgi:hypothetical protein